MVFAIKPGDEYISTCQSLAKHLTICYIAKQPSSQSCGTFPLKDIKWKLKLSGFGSLTYGIVLSFSCVFPRMK